MTMLLVRHRFASRLLAGTIASAPGHRDWADDFRLESATLPAAAPGSAGKVEPS